MPIPGSCPVCEETRWSDILEERSQVVHVGRLFATEKEAWGATRGDIVLARCQGCGYVGNRAYLPIDDAFQPGYDASLHHSRIYLEFLERLADDLIARHALAGKTVLEVACGPGFFLRLMLQRGAGAGIGVDPSLESQGADSEGGKPITWIRDFYDDRYAHLPVDLVTCRQAMHTMPDPMAFVKAVREALAGRPRVPVYFEVVNAENLFQKDIVWQMLYEYRSYFDVASLSSLLRRGGFHVSRVGPCYVDGQYLQIEATAGPGSGGGGGDITPRGASEEQVRRIHRFGEVFRSQIAGWRDRLRRLIEARRRVVAWGAAGRGITFLNLVDRDRAIGRIVDINPARQGKFIPGTGARVVAPEALREEPPDVIILTNATYQHEIRKQATDLGLSCEFLLA
jgi:SAM-dependent methyltransferase